MTVMNVPTFERFFRVVASLDVDEQDVKRYSAFVNQELYDLLVMGEVSAKANGRDLIEPWDLPVTRGLQERTHEFEKLDEQIRLEPILEHIAMLPQLDLGVSDETESRLPVVAGGISVALARSFAIIEPQLRNPSTKHWNRAFRLFQLLL